MREATGTAGRDRGLGKRLFEVVEGWGKLPPGYRYKEVTSVAVDSKDNVYVFSRGEHPVIVFDREGHFLRSWGEGFFQRPHAITIGPDDEVWAVDDLGHAVRKYTTEGKELMHLLTPGTPAPPYQGLPFHRPTHVAVDPRTRDSYVSDGYGNSRSHKFDSAGRLLFSWGETGTNPGCFHTPHCLTVDRGGTVFVADRENHRIQRFDSDGRYLGQWNNLNRPNGIAQDPGREGYFFVAEAGLDKGINTTLANIGQTICVLSVQGDIVGRIGGPFGGEEPGQFIAPHNVAVDSHGDLYVPEVTFSVVGRHENPPRELRSLQKLARVTY